jgi:dihydrofolate reductase
MSKVRVNCFAVSADGFGAGPEQSLEHPLGIGGEALHEWAFATAAFKKMFGETGGNTGIDNGFIVGGFDDVGAWILGRNMFGPVRGPWPDENWRGWWGENPPYHVPAFVLTNHARAPLVMEGGTTFHFITGGIHEALEKAKEAAQGKDVRIGGGVSVICQYLQAGLIDELHVAVAPVLLGKGEALWAGMDMESLGYRCAEAKLSDRVMHLRLLRKHSG